LPGGQNSHTPERKPAGQARQPGPADHVATARRVIALRSEGLSSAESTEQVGHPLATRGRWSLEHHRSVLASHPSEDMAFDRKRPSGRRVAAPAVDRMPYRVHSLVGGGVGGECHRILKWVAVDSAYPAAEPEGEVGPQRSVHNLRLEPRNVDLRSTPLHRFSARISRMHAAMRCSAAR